MKSTARASLREDQQALTRTRMLEAAAELLADDEDLAFRAIAARAGVSVPTVYRHFATPEELISALLEHLERRLGVQRHPRTLEEYAAMLPELFAAFQENERFMLAYLRAPSAVAIRERNWRRRAATLRAGLPPHPALADPALAQRFAGLLLAMGSSPTWHALLTVTDLRGADIGRAVSWGIRALAQSVAQDPESFREAFSAQEPT